jgi:hypothetical protein
VLFLLLIAFGPTSGSRRLIATLVLAALFFTGLEIWRRMTPGSFRGGRAVPPLRRRLRSAPRQGGRSGSRARLPPLRLASRAFASCSVETTAASAERQDGRDLGAHAGRLEILNVPPVASTRSRRPSRPEPGLTEAPPTPSSAIARRRWLAGSRRRC